jgi:sucrose-6-phosphate hydrolase SacC (GH32 family)
MPGMPFNQQMLFPVELTLHTTGDGLRMFAYPVEEIENIYGREHSWSNETLEPGENLLSEVGGELFDIDAEFAVGEADQFGFMIRGCPVVYNVAEERLSGDDEYSERAPVDGKIRLRILVDRTSIEIFGNDGRIYMPIRALPQGNKSGLQIMTEGAETKVVSLKVRELNSIWD